jgi:hypothetical protein
MALLVALAVLGTVVAAAGVYALTAYSVNQSTPDLALRMAIGASSGALIRMTLWQTGKYGAAGLLTGSLLSSGASQAHVAAAVRGSRIRCSRSCHNFVSARSDGLLGGVSGGPPRDSDRPAADDADPITGLCTTRRRFYSCWLTPGLGG